MPETGQEATARAEVAGFMRRLYARRLTTSSGGNIALRLDHDMVAITPSATDKGRMRPEDIALVDLDGVNHIPLLKPSIETGMHLQVLRRNPAVRAVIHAHPPCASVFAVTGRPLRTTMLAEAYALLGQLAVAPYALMGSDALAEGVAQALGGHGGVLMAHHGVLTVGECLLEAFDRLEVLENTARIQLLAEQSGNPLREIPPADLEALDRLMGRKK